MPTSLQGQLPGQQLAFIPEPAPEQIAETLVAMANSDGGSVVIGVTAGGELGRLASVEDAADAVTAAQRLCRPPVKTDWRQEQVGDGLVVTLRVERSTEIHGMADGRVLQRRGVDNVPVEPAELERLITSRSLGEFELMPVPGARRDDFDEDVVDEYLEKRQKRNPGHTILPKDKLLQQIGALTQDRTPTVSGILLFGREPQLFLPHSRAIFVKFADTAPRGPDSSFGYGRREEFLGPLPRIVERAYRVIWEEMKRFSVVKGLQRHEETEYPWASVREALVNAVAHRDYRLTGRSIEIRMYTDRMEITSPGGLPAHITLDNLVEEHYSRNPRLVNGLHQWGYIEELGLGIDQMIEEMVKAGHPPPQFDAKSHRFSVILFNRRDTNRSVTPWEGTMNERQMKAIEFMRQGGSITNSDYRALCPEVGPESLRLDLADLVNRGILLKIGDKRGTRYILK
jgi:ATP-dependent DNA helicase RecG